MIKIQQTCPTKSGNERSGGGQRPESFGSKIIIISNIFEGTKKTAGKAVEGGITLKSSSFQSIEENIFKDFTVSNTINGHPILK